MDRVLVRAAMVVLAGALAGCAAGVSEPTVEPAAAEPPNNPSLAAEPPDNPRLAAALAALAPAAGPTAEVEMERVVVSSEAPLALAFTSNLTAAERALVRGELADEVAAGRARGGPVTPLVARYDLNADGRDEVFLTLRANAWCGSGNVCNVWVFDHADDGWVWLSDGADGASRVSILPTATGGYRDVRLHGQCGHELCAFDLGWTGDIYGWNGNAERTARGRGA